MTNVTLERIAERLRDAKNVVLLTHEKLDGDALGGTLALARTLKQLGIKATPVYAGAWTKRFDPIVGGTHVIQLGDEPNLDLIPSNPDWIVISDTGSWSQLSKVRAWLEPRTEKTMVIDHHLHGDATTAAVRHIETGAAAVCQTIAELCRILLCVDRVDELPKEIAEPLYLGLATDTGWFRHSNVTPDALRLASELLEAGADHARLFRLTEQMDKPGRLRLIARALTSMELHSSDQIAVIALTLNDLKECDANMNEAGGLTDMLLTMAPVRVGACLTEVGESRTKISFRSKTGEGAVATVDVNQVARTIGGGGHAQAAGARLELPIGEAKARVIAALQDAVS